jgi:putative endonuclease
VTVKETFGRYGEDLAVETLLGLGYVVEERNWRCPQGELDIVAWDGDVLVFVEVKTRSSNAFGTGAEAVTGEKLLRMRRAMTQWLLVRRPPFVHLRIDVVTVTTLRDAPPVIEHIKAVS